MRALLHAIASKPFLIQALVPRLVSTLLAHTVRPAESQIGTGEPHMPASKAAGLHAGTWCIHGPDHQVQTAQQQCCSLPVLHMVRPALPQAGAGVSPLPAFKLWSRLGSEAVTLSAGQFCCCMPMLLAHTLRPAQQQAHTGVLHQELQACIACLICCRLALVSASCTLPALCLFTEGGALSWGSQDVKAPCMPPSTVCFTIVATAMGYDEAIACR